MNTSVAGSKTTNEGSGFFALSEYASYINAVSEHDIPAIEYEASVRVSGVVCFDTWVTAVVGRVLTIVAF